MQIDFRLEDINISRARRPLLQIIENEGSFRYFRVELITDEVNISVSSYRSVLDRFQTMRYTFKQKMVCLEGLDWSYHDVKIFKINECHLSVQYSCLDSSNLKKWLIFSKKFTGSIRGLLKRKEHEINKQMFTLLN